MNWLTFAIGCYVGYLIKMVVRLVNEKKTNRNDIEFITIPITRCNECGELILKIDNPFYKITCPDCKMEKDESEPNEEERKERREFVRKKFAEYMEKKGKGRKNG